VRLTTARYYTPSGRSIQAKGIDPDIEVLNEVPDELKGKDETKGEAALRGHLKNGERGEGRVLRLRPAGSQERQAAELRLRPPARREGQRRQHPAQAGRRQAELSRHGLERSARRAFPPRFSFRHGNPRHRPLPGTRDDGLVFRYDSYDSVVSGRFLRPAPAAGRSSLREASG
jgi:hypothetical protein